MLQCTFRPIVNWPGKPTPSDKRQRSRFKDAKKFSRTLNDLETELRHLRAKEIAIRLFLSATQIRNDGWPRSDARPAQPGVILEFESKHGALRYICDRYADWVDNLRAIAQTLEALRAADRHGVTKGGEQYRGWKALPEASSADACTEHARVIVRYASLTERDAARLFSDRVFFDQACAEAMRRRIQTQQGTATDRTTQQSFER
jgi:hypothetical protein